MTRYIILAFAAILLSCNQDTTDGADKKSEPDSQTESATVHDQDPREKAISDSLAARRFDPTFGSVDALVQAFLTAALNRNEAALRSLLVTEREFTDWLWPEFPMSAPAMNVPTDFAWNNLARKNDKGIRNILRTAAGKSFTLQTVRFVEEEERFKTFVVRGGTRIDVTDGQRRAFTLEYPGSIVVLNGSYKFMSYRE